MYFFVLYRGRLNLTWSNTKPRQIMQYKILREQLNRATKDKRKWEARRSFPAVWSQFFGNWRGDANVRSGYREWSSCRSNRECRLDRIIDLDEWPKFDQRGRSAILDDEGQGPRENFQEHTWFVSPPAPHLSHFFLGSLFIYLLLFRGPRIFFLPLGRPSAATEGEAKM